MKLTISAIGKMKSGPEQELFSRYLTRAKSIGAGIGFPNVSLVEYSESKSSNTSIRKDQEADLILAGSGQAIILAFDENGKDYSSQQFSSLLANYRDDSTPNMVFALGGPDGHGDALLKKAKLTIRLGKMTWPHQIARILLIEQIYRAMTIMSGHPYHRE